MKHEGWGTLRRFKYCPIKTMCRCAVGFLFILYHHFTTKCPRPVHQTHWNGRCCAFHSCFFSCPHVWGHREASGELCWVVEELLWPDQDRRGGTDWCTCVGWLSGLGGSMLSQIVQMALPLVLSVIMLYVVIKLSPCVFHRILLPPLRVAVLESPPPCRKVWGPKLPPVSKAKPSSGPFSVVQTNRTTLLLGTVRAVRGRWSFTAQQRALSGHSISFILQFKSVLV